MALEIERKFLVDVSQFDFLLPLGSKIVQAYADEVDDTTFRVRIYDSIKAELCIKSNTIGVTRKEFEYEIPCDDAIQLLQLGFKHAIFKDRFRVEHDNFVWSIDIFQGLNAGLILGEIELESEDQEFSRPAWAIQEVSNDPRYFNVNLAKRPYTQW